MSGRGCEGLTHLLGLGEDLYLAGGIRALGQEADERGAVVWFFPRGFQVQDGAVGVLFPERIWNRQFAERFKVGSCVSRRLWSQQWEREAG